MAEHTKTGLEYVEGFFLLAGVLWLAGALLVGSLALMGQGRVAGTPIESNATPVADGPTQ